MDERQKNYELIDELFNDQQLQFFVDILKK